MIINCPKCKTELDLPDEAVTFKVECDCCGEKTAATASMYNKILCSGRGFLHVCYLAQSALPSE